MKMVFKAINLKPLYWRKTNDIVDKYLTLKFFVPKPCLITTQIKRSRSSIRVNYYTPKCSKALVSESTLINVRVNSCHAKLMAAPIWCNKAYLFSRFFSSKV